MYIFFLQLEKHVFYHFQFFENSFFYLQFFENRFYYLIFFENSFEFLAEGFVSHDQYIQTGWNQSQKITEK